MQLLLKPSLPPLYRDIQISRCANCISVENIPNTEEATIPYKGSSLTMLFLSTAILFTKEPVNYVTDSGRFLLVFIDICDEPFGVMFPYL